MDGLEFLLIGSDLQLESRAISEGRKAFFLGILPNCQSVDIIKAEQEKLNPYFTRVTLLKTPKETLDAFLKEMFNGMELLTSCELMQSFISAKNLFFLWQRV